MPRIIEIWRDSGGIDIPVKFTVGEVPQVLNENGNLVGMEGEAPPVVTRIKCYATGAVKGDAYVGPCFVIQFEDSDVRRIIPAHVVIDVGFDSESTTIKLLKEDQETETATPELPEE